jgi:hypothetical protein
MEDELRGVVDLVRWKAIYFEGEKGYASRVSLVLSVNAHDDYIVTLLLNPTKFRLKSSTLRRPNVLSF